MSSDFKTAVIEAMAESSATVAVEDLYREVMVQIDLRKPRCDISGRCCRFEEFGHRLYVTTFEMAAFLEGLANHPAYSPTKLSDAMAAWDGTGCLFQIQKLCTVHLIRPFGCRMFFCDPTATQWQQEQYEFFHERLKTLHQTLHIPYFYMEWRGALAECLPILQDNV